MKHIKYFIITLIIAGFAACELPDNVDPKSTFLLADDICDGGGTFLGLARELERKYGDVKKHLFCTHGIFSKGVKDLLGSYATIGTTDSYVGRVQIEDFRGVFVADMLLQVSSSFSSLDIICLGLLCVTAEFRCTRICIERPKQTTLQFLSLQ